jgi:hypothetical protein
MPGSEVVITLTAASQDIGLLQAYFVYLENGLNREPAAMRSISQVNIGRAFK